MHCIGLMRAAFTVNRFNNLFQILVSKLIDYFHGMSKRQIKEEFANGFIDECPINVGDTLLHSGEKYKPQVLAVKIAKIKNNCVRNRLDTPCNFTIK